MEEDARAVIDNINTKIVHMGPLIWLRAQDGTTENKPACSTVIATSFNPICALDLRKKLK